ncbi:DedA family protein [Cellulomonas sp. P22]|uniref:DedA family protein n=1 Tax=Cellulomonas sp. P22 TaxID=3373189 RepID=UPI0037B3F6C3
MLEEWILALGGSGWVYGVVWAFAAIDGFFPPVPSESVVIALAAISVTTGGPHPALLAVVAAAGAFTGDQIAYAIGSRVDAHRLRIFRTRRGAQALRWAEDALAHRGSSFILAARYIPVGRVAVNMTAGALGYPRRRFVALTALAGVTWGVYGVLIGMGAGAWLHDHPVTAVVVGVVLGAVVGIVIDRVLHLWLGAGGRPTVLGRRASRAPVADLTTPTEEHGGATGRTAVTEGVVPRAARP